jgi:hypothetical protein
VADTLFDIAAEQLEHHSSLDLLPARGTLRIALKESGLDAKSLTLQQLGVVFEKVMPKELKLRGVGDAARVCNAVMDDLANSPATADAAPARDVDDVFRRLAKG